MITRRYVFALALSLAAMGSLAASAKETLKSRTFRFTYQAAVRELPAGAQTLDLWLPYPQSDRNQTIHQVTLHAPGAITLAKNPKTGNMDAYLHVERPQLPVEVSLEVTATRRENAGEPETLTAAEAKPYLQAEPLIPLDGAVRQVAVEATAGLRTDAEKIRAIYEKVTGMMKYDKSGTGWGRGDAVFACDAKRGNCTDFHSLIIGMARTEGIPARFAIGFPLPEKRGAGEIPGYHCWAEMHQKGRGWVPVDSSEGSKALALGNVEKKNYFFGHHDENRIQFSAGRNLVLAPAQKGAPLNYFVYPYAEVDGKEYPKVERKFSFQDLEDTSVAAR
jgi:transglutaminase-like putative cysteine protease